MTTFSRLVHRLQAAIDQAEAMSDDGADDAAMDAATVRVLHAEDALGDAIATATPGAYACRAGSLLAIDLDALGIDANARFLIIEPDAIAIMA